MAQTGRQGAHGVAKLYMLIHWVGSPDLGIVHLFPLGCSAPNAKTDQGNGHFRFLARGSKFSKGALRAVGAMACVAAAGGTYHECRRRCTSAVQVTIGCAEQAFLMRCKHSSTAASSPAVQLEQPQASTRESQQESRGSRSFSQESSTALQDAALCGILLSPSLLSKENGHFRPSFHKKIACGAPKNASSPCLTLVAGAARPESATRLVSIIPVSHEGVSPSRARLILPGGLPLTTP